MHASLLSTVKTALPEACHRLCAHHMMNRITRPSLGGPNDPRYMQYWACIDSETEFEFHKNPEILEALHRPAADYLRSKSQDYKIANFALPKQAAQWRMRTNNMAERAMNTLKDMREENPVLFFKGYLLYLATTFADRREHTKNYANCKGRNEQYYQYFRISHAD